MSRNNQSSRENSETDYHAHIARLARAQSVLTDIPHYGDTHRMFNNKRVVYEEDYQDQPKNPNTTPFNEKVEVIEYKEAIESPNDANAQVGEETDYYQQRRKGFGLCKWKTFKGH